MIIFFLSLILSKNPLTILCLHTSSLSEDYALKKKEYWIFRREKRKLERALLEKVREGDLDEVKRILSDQKYNINVNLKIGEETPFYVAYHTKDNQGNKREDIIDYLLQKGADPNTANFSGDCQVQWIL